MRKKNRKSQQYDVQDLLNAVRCAYYAEYKQPIGEKTLIVTTHELIDKPFQMVQWIRKWLLNCGESDNITMCWLREHI